MIYILKDLKKLIKTAFEKERFLRTLIRILNNKLTIDEL